jgi:hypothetical protein
MKTVFFQWYEGPSGRRFTTLHPSGLAALRFRALVRGKWVSKVASKVGAVKVPNKVHGYIMTRLRGRDGLRAYVDDFTTHKMV